MGSRLLPFWNRLQLTSLRLLTVILGMVDGLLHVHWGERLLDRLSDRWQSELTRLDEALSSIEQERERLQLQAEALAIHAAAIYLGGRSLARHELRFDPVDPHDEELLDASIELLVKKHLAAVESEAVGEGRYVYRLEPDWAAIHQRLTEAADRAGAEVLDSYREGLRFIDEAFLSG
jgi:hypothetical protein